MSIRLRRVNGALVALCAARSIEKPGDRYLDDDEHHALAAKFSRDFSSEGLMAAESFGEENLAIVEAEESNNPNREWRDRTYASAENQ